MQQPGQHTPAYHQRHRSRRKRSNNYKRNKNNKLLHPIPSNEIDKQIIIQRIYEQQNEISPLIQNSRTLQTQSVSFIQLNFYTLKTGIITTKELIDKIELLCDNYIIVPGYNKTLLFTFKPIQQQFKFFAILKNLLELLSLYICTNIILNHLRLNKMPIYSNVQEIYEQKIIKIFLKYLQYNFEFNYMKERIPRLTKHTCKLQSSILLCIKIL